MEKSTCILNACEKSASPGRYCKLHRERMKATGAAERPCKACGKDIVGTYGPKVYCSDACKPKCEATACSRKVAGRSGYCKIHHDGIAHYGRLPQYSWASSKHCVVCGKSDWPSNNRRSICSPACAQILSRGGGVAPERAKQCVRCTTIIDLSILHPSGRKKRQDVQICADCFKAKSTRHRMSVTELADRDGTVCGICSGLIDMNLVFPDPIRASVDHVMPYASGGTHDPENLQLAHLRCNMVKQNRPGFVM